ALKTPNLERSLLEKLQLPHDVLLHFGRVNRWIGIALHHFFKRGIVCFDQRSSSCFLRLPISARSSRANGRCSEPDFSSDNAFAGGQVVSSISIRKISDDW